MIYKILSKLKSKGYRDAFVKANIRNGLAHQIKAIRDQRGWTQTQLAELCNVKQSVISRWEDPAYGKYSIESLTKLASAFDVAMLVKFVPYSRLLSELEDLSPATLSAESFSNEVVAIEEAMDQFDRSISARQTPSGLAITRVGNTQAPNYVHVPTNDTLHDDHKNVTFHGTLNTGYLTNA